MENECPCIDCVCVAVCRHKSWSDLMRRCSLVCNYLSQHSTHNGVHRYRLVIEKILKPTNWTLDEKGYFTGELLYGK